MMKSKSAKYIFIFCAFTFFKVKAQNIILNPSFEILTTCPSNGAFNIKYATPWFSPVAPDVDIFNTCIGVPNGAVPSNIFGYQNPKTGNGYAGFYAKVLVNGRKYLSQKLTRPLVNKKYCLLFYVNLCDSSNIGISKIGAYFSKDSTKETEFINFNYAPQVINDTTNFITDKINWVPISGKFTAEGGEQFITIGNFNNGANTPTKFAPGGTQLISHAYYYIDDVSLYQLIEAEAGENKTICNGESATLGDATLPNTGYSWQPSTGLSNATEAMPIANPTQTTTYTLTINYTGPNCTGKLTDTVTVHVNPCPNVYIANVFSPNNDGNNDVLKIEGNAIATLYFAVYNRWGNLVFETHSQNQTWDGTQKGTPCEAGVYVYYLKGKYTDGKAIEQKGTITLVR